MQYADVTLNCLASKRDNRRCRRLPIQRWYAGEGGKTTYGIDRCVTPAVLAPRRLVLAYKMLLEVWRRPCACSNPKRDPRQHGGSPIRTWRAACWSFWSSTTPDSAAAANTGASSLTGCDGS